MLLKFDIGNAILVLLIFPDISIRDTAAVMKPWLDMFRVKKMWKNVILMTDFMQLCVLCVCVIYACLPSLVYDS